MGWVDVYPWALPDQDLDISGIPDGDYWLVSIADPGHLINEGGGAAENNNTAAVKLHLGSDIVWSDDAVPEESVTGVSGGDSWKWIDSDPAPFSGSLAHQSAVKAGPHQHFFFGTTRPLPVNTNNTLFTCVYLDPVNLPSEVMLQWATTNWEHRAYWGTNSIALGTNGTASRYYMGPLPQAGQWVRLEVPASLVGLEGAALYGLSFVLSNGRATWDYTGVYVAPPSPGSTPPPVATNAWTSRRLST